MQSTRWISMFLLLFTKCSFESMEAWVNETGEVNWGLALHGSVIILSSCRGSLDLYSLSCGFFPHFTQFLILSYYYDYNNLWLFVVSHVYSLSSVIVLLSMFVLSFFFNKFTLEVSLFFRQRTLFFLYKKGVLFWETNLRLTTNENSSLRKEKKNKWER